MRSGAGIFRATTAWTASGLWTRARSGALVVRVGAALLGAVAFVGLVVLLYACSVHAASSNSDGATVLLEGQSIAHGQLTLSGWSLSLDSFWLADALFYALFIAVAGMHADFLNLVPAVIAALCVVAGVWLAAVGRRPAAAIAGGACVLTLLALPTDFFASFYLQGPLHVGTALWCLVAFVLLRKGELGWRFALAVVLLGAGILSDLQALFFGAVPIALAGLLFMRRRRSLRAGLVPVAAAAASAVVAIVLRGIGDAVGTYYVNSPQQQITRSQMVANVSLIWNYGLKVLGIGSPGLVGPNIPEPLEAVHLVGLVIVVAAVFALLRLVAGVLALTPRTVWRLLVAVVRGTPFRPVLAEARHRRLAAKAEETAARADRSAGAEVGRRGRIAGLLGAGSLGPEFLDDVLLLAFVADLLVFVSLTGAAALPYARYLSAAVIFGAILAGRMLAELVEHIPAGWWRRSLAVAGALVLLAYGAAAGFDLDTPTPGQPVRALASFLEAHHLRIGIGDYWASSITTVESHDAVLIRPVISGPGGKLVAYPRNSKPAWFTGQRYQFYVYDAGPFGGVTQTAADLTFGRPAHTYEANGYTILVWSHPVKLPLGALGGS